MSCEMRTYTARASNARSEPPRTGVQRLLGARSPVGRRERRRLSPIASHDAPHLVRVRVRVRAKARVRVRINLG